MLRTIASVLSRGVVWGDTQVQARLILEHVGIPEKNNQPGSLI
jgi:hypothetical protein